MSEESIILKNWRRVVLKDICEKVNIVRRKEIDPNSELTYLDIGCIDNGTNRIVNDKQFRWSEAPSRAQQIVQKNDILFSTVRTYLKNIAIIENGNYNNPIASSGFTVIRGKLADVDAKFLFHKTLSSSFLEPLNRLQTGSSYPAVRDSDVFAQEFLLPSLAEQQAIVSKLEELFSKLDNGVESLKTLQQQLKVYRQAVLKWAFEGKLTGRKSKWNVVKLSEVANAIDPQPSHRTPPVASNGVPYVSIKDFDSENDKIDFTKARIVDVEVLNEHLARYTLEIGDFVIGKIGTIGKPVRLVLPQDYTLSANIVLIQPRKINPTYLYYFFQSNTIEKAFTAGMNATTQAAFGIQKVRELKIELPEKEEQQFIVDEIESRLSVCDKIEETITNGLKEAEALRQSILKQAFEGKLV